MTRTLALTVAVGLLAPAACVAQTSTPVATGGHGGQVAVATAPGQEVSMSAGLESAYVLQGSDGQAFLVIDLQSTAPPEHRVRPAMSVALVIDRSGSMAGEKMANARAAAMSFVQSMSDGDVLAIYTYDDRVEQVAPPTTIDANTRAPLTAVIQGITPRGSTNLFGGLTAGIEALSGAAAERPVRRVILISDGLANIGPSSPAELGNTAARGAARGISITTIGVGLDYDESIMTTVAVRSGGRFYHLQEPAQLASILETELNALSMTVARDVLIELQPSRGVEILGASGADLRREGGRVQLAVGDMLGNQSRQIVVPVRVPTSGAAEQTLASLRLRYALASSGTRRRAEAAVRYRLTSARDEVDRHVRPAFAQAVETYRNAEAQRRAAQLVSQGNAQQARVVLQARSEEVRRRARSVGGERAQVMFDDADEIAEQAEAVGAARSAPAARAMELELEDAAMDAEGY